MDQSSSQSTMPRLHRTQVTSDSLPPEYWDSLDALSYTGSGHHPPPQHQHQHPNPQSQQQQQQQQQQPLGISWDHPVFHRQSQPHPQGNNHGIYSQTPQNWHQNPLQQPVVSPTPQGYGLAEPYQVHHFPQEHVAFGSQPLNPSDNATYPAYSLTQAYYHPQNLSVQDTFSQSPRPQNIQPRTPQPVSYQPPAHPTSIAQYSIPGYSEDISHAPINFPNGYHEASSRVGNQHTINPQFLDTPPQPHSSNQQHAPLQNNFLYLNPADFERAGSGRVPISYYENLRAPTPSQTVVPHPNLMPNPNDPNGIHKQADSGLLAPAKPAKAAEPKKKKKKTASKKQSDSQTRKATPKFSVEIPGTKLTASSESETDSSDESDLEIVAPKEPEEPSPIPAARPSEPVAAAEYDTLQAVWSPRNRRPNVDKVKNALVAFKDVVKTVRDAWKEKAQAMKVAENQGDNDKAAELKKDVVLGRRLMDVVVNTTLEKGHPMIVEKLGEHPMAVAAMYSFLLDRHSASDFDGALTTSILKLFARFVTMDEEVLQKTNVAKLLPRFVKKGGPAVKELAQRVLDNAAASTKRKQESAKGASKDESSGKSPAPETAAEVAGNKRLREGESNGQPAAKRMVVTSNLKTATKPGVTGIVNNAAKRPTEAAQDSKAAPALASRPKANIVAPKPTSLFGSLASASKRPGTSNAERAAAAAAAKASNATQKKEAAPPAKPAFSFGDLMADLNKQKETVAAEPAADRPPETEEERAKRLRKEERRKLRVSWKPDESLTEVRLFTHDPDEELGPGDGSQGGDVKGEGRVLKLHRDLDEEDDDEVGVREQELLTYYMASEIDFDDMVMADPAEDLAVARSKAFIKRAGTQQPTSTEKEAQEHREATTLMVFYTSPADIPPSPKEPPPPSDDEMPTDQLPFGEPPDHIKARQERYYAYINPKPASTPPATAPNNQFDISNLLKIIQSAPQQQQPTSPTHPVPQAAPMSDLERTISLFRQQQAQVQTQPQPQPQPQLPQIPQLPVSQPAATQGIDFTKLLAVVNAQKQMQQQPPVFQQPAQVPPSQPAIAPNLAAIISQLSNQNQPAPTHEEPDRKRMRDPPGGRDGMHEDRFNQYKRSRPNGDRPKKHPKAGLVPCRYFPLGKCYKGEECTYRHDLD